MREKPLSRKEQAFVNGLLAGKTKKQAAIDAGYSRTSAQTTASELLQRPAVKEVLHLHYRREEEEVGLDRERIRDRFFRLAMADASQAFDDSHKLLPKDKIPKDVQELIISARTWDSPDAGKGSAVKLESPKGLMKDYLRMFPAPPAGLGAQLGQAAAEVEAEMEDLIAKLHAEQDETAA